SILLAAEPRARPSRQTRGGIRMTYADVFSEVRVLVVEDDADLLESIRSALSPRYRVTTSPSPGAALNLVGSGKHFDVLVCGYQMLEMSGRELRDRLGEIDPVLAHNSLLVVCGRLSEEDEEDLDQVNARARYDPVRTERPPAE